MTRESRVRLDNLLLLRGLAESRQKARALILAGWVLVEDKVVDKAGALVPLSASLRLKEQLPYVSRGGIKLKGALDHFGLKVRDFVVLDVGAATGGFTDCLLQEGAKKVYALDVGYGQLALKLRNDDRVVVIERTNIRHFDGALITEPIDLAVIDVSFISLKLVLPAVLRLIKDEAYVLALIKPQFEVSRGEVGKRGVVRDRDKHERVIKEISNFCGEIGISVLGCTPCCLPGPAGNREFFIYGRKRGKGGC